MDSLGFALILKIPLHNFKFAQACLAHHTAVYADSSYWIHWQLTFHYKMQMSHNIANSWGNYTSAVR